MNYHKLATAGNEKYSFPSAVDIPYPAGEVTDWYGFKRHNFVFENCPGFIVAPPHPAQGLPWSWCLQWADSFVPRTPALQLLDRGFHHVYLNVFSTYMNQEGVRICEKFYSLLQSLKFHSKAALLGMSYGGLFALRWAIEHPETAGAIWLDAPVCSLAFAAESCQDPHREKMHDFFSGEAKKHFQAYQVADLASLQNHPLNPLNNCQIIAKHHIPVLAIRSGQDQTVVPERNIDILAERITAAGGNIQIIRRDLYGHHPHGLDDPTPLTGFILQHYPEININNKTVKL